MTELLLMNSPDHLIIRKEGKLYHRIGNKEILISAYKDQAVYLQALSAKWRFYQVINKYGEMGVELEGDKLPQMKMRRNKELGYFMQVI